MHQYDIIMTGLRNGQWYKGMLSTVQAQSSMSVLTAIRIRL